MAGLKWYYLKPGENIYIGRDDSRDCVKKSETVENKIKIILSLNKSDKYYDKLLIHLSNTISITRHNLIQNKEHLGDFDRDSGWDKVLVDKFGFQMTLGKLNCLNPSNWLNDEVSNYSDVC